MKRVRLLPVLVDALGTDLFTVLKFTLLMFIVLTFTVMPAPAAAEGPKGQSMLQLLAEMTGYAYDKKGEAADKSDEIKDDLKELGERFESAVKDGEDPTALALNLQPSIDLGSSAGDIASTMLEIYGDFISEFFGSCGDYQIVGACYKCEVFPPHCKFLPYVSYQFPFELMESVDVPFKSRLFPDVLVSVARPLAVMARDLILSGAGIDSQDMALRLKSRGFKGIDAETPNTSLRGNNNTELRIGLPINNSYSYAEHHFFDSFFDEATTIVNDLATCHTSMMAPIPYLSEGPIGMMVSRLRTSSALMPGLSESTATVQDPRGILQYCLDRSFKNHTPDDLPLLAGDADGAAEMRIKLAGADSDKLCLPGNLGPKGPYTNVAKQNYGAMARWVGYYRAAVAGAVLSLNFHKIREKKEGNKERSRIQELSPADRIENKECRGGKNFIPDYWAPDSETANVRKWGDGGEAWLAANWQYIRCCPSGYKPVPGFPTPQVKK